MASVLCNAPVQNEGPRGHTPDSNLCTCSLDSLSNLVTTLGHRPSTAGLASLSCQYVEGPMYNVSFLADPDFLNPASCNALYHVQKRHIHMDIVHWHAGFTAFCLAVGCMHEGRRQQGKAKRQMCHQQTAHTSTISSMALQSVPGS